MSLYIHPENQRVLWTTINKVTGFSEKRDADAWFKQVIAHFYHQNSNRVLGKDELLKLNKETIEYMIQQLKSVPSVVNASSVTASMPSADPDTKMSTNEMNTLLQLRSLQDQIDELRVEIRALKKPT
jgi:hypothetical protein